jgi:hypothetical protein
LKEQIDSLADAGQLKDAIGRNDRHLFQSMMRRNPAYATSRDSAGDSA